MEENKMNLEPKQEKQYSQEEKIKLYQMAQVYITKKMEIALKLNTNLKDKDDIKIATETEILMPLTEANISEKIKKEIEFVMKVYDTVFDKVYQKYIDEKEKQEKVDQIKSTQIQKEKDEIKPMTIEEKAKAFNALIRETMSKMPKEYLKEMGQEKKQIEYTPLRSGEPVENNQDSKDMGER